MEWFAILKEDLQNLGGEWEIQNRVCALICRLLIRLPTINIESAILVDYERVSLNSDKIYNNSTINNVSGYLSCTFT